MSYLGGYLGGDSTPATTPTTATVPSVVVSPYVPTALAYVDHVQEALNRLCEQFKGAD